MIDSLGRFAEVEFDVLRADTRIDNPTRSVLDDDLACSGDRPGAIEPGDRPRE